MSCSELYKGSWCTHRAHLLPQIRATEKRNAHRFARQIDQALTSGRASLFFNLDGFVVLEPCARKDGTWVVVLFAMGWCDEAVACYHECVTELARQIGAEGIECQTVVSALAPNLESAGFQRVGQRGRLHIWQRRVSWADDVQCHK